MNGWIPVLLSQVLVTDDEQVRRDTTLSAAAGPPALAWLLRRCLLHYPYSVLLPAVVVGVHGPVESLPTSFG